LTNEEKERFNMEYKYSGRQRLGKALQMILDNEIGPPTRGYLKKELKRGGEQYCLEGALCEVYRRYAGHFYAKWEGNPPRIFNCYTLMPDRIMRWYELQKRVATSNDIAWDEGLRTWPEIINRVAELAPEIKSAMEKC
jgi:hypothetical protein